MKVRFWANVLALCALFVALRWSLFKGPLVRDEGEYAYAGQLIRHGQMPYAHSFLQKPPMIAYTYALAGITAPDSFWFPRVLAYLSAAGATVLLGWIARVEWGKGSQWPVMWLVTPMLLLPGRDQWTANTEMFMLLPLLATVAVYVSRRTAALEAATPDKASAGKGAWLAGGAMAAITFWYKYTALPLLILVFAVWALEEFKVRGSKFKVQGSRFLFGAAAATFLVLAPFLLSDGGWHLWDCTIRFNRLYAASESFGASGLWFWLEKFCKNWWPLFLLPLALVPEVRRPRLWFWVAMFFATWLTTAMSHYGHYYILVMPFWALLAGAGVDRLAGWLARLPAGARTFLSAAMQKCSPTSLRTRISATRFTVTETTEASSGRTAATCLRTALTVCVVALLCWRNLPAIFHLAIPADLRALPAMMTGPQVVARHVAEMTSQNDYVLVAGSEPQILTYAKRFSPTRFDTMYPLMIPTPLAKGYQREAMQEIEAHRPAAIVFVSDPSSWLRHTNSPPEFFRYLDWLMGTQYELVGGYLPSGQWTEPITERESGPAVFRVYRAKKSKID